MQARYSGDGEPVAFIAGLPAPCLSVTFVMIPSVTTSCTSSAHPEGSRADAKCRVDMFSNRLDRIPTRLYV